jgi:putative ubiquitin-RnfH superfamily antitoxin RatB of RatAB toxin-antitoxin module
MSKLIKVEIVYALPQQQSLLAVSVSEGADIEKVINTSGVLERHHEIDLAINKVGIWNKPRKLSEIVRENDRIEIYRPLIADPKEVRRRRAEEARVQARK